MIADLLAHGLIRSSFVPEQEIQELRDLLRTRNQLTRQESIDFADAAIQDIDRNIAALIARKDQEVEAGQTRASFQSLILRRRQPKLVQSSR